MRKLMVICGAFLLAVGLMLTSADKVAAEGALGDIPWNFALSGDIVYDFTAAAPGAGASVNLMTFYPDALVEVRGGFYELVNRQQKVGLTLAINLVAGARRIGATWIPERINSSLGVTALVGFRDDESFSQVQITPGIHLTVIRIDF